MENNDTNVTSVEKNNANENYPALCEIKSTRAREILVLTVIGMTQDAIAKRLGVTQSAVSQAIATYDPQGLYKPNMDLRKEVIKSSLGTVVLEALRHLMDKTDEMKDYTPNTIINLIGKIEGIQKDLGGKLDTPSSVQDSLNELKKG